MVLQRIRAALGTPFFEAEGVLIYNMDCLHGLHQLESNIVDLTVTSPPYNIGKAYETALSANEYLDWCEACGT